MLGRNHRHSSSQRPESVQGIVEVVVAHVIYACTAACEIADTRHDDVIDDTQQSKYLHQHHTITAQYHYTWPYISTEE